MDALTKAFLEWANRKGYDTAHAYNQNKGRWMFLHPMTADLYEAWQAAQAEPEEKLDFEKLESLGWQIAICAMCGTHASAIKPAQSVPVLGEPVAWACPYHAGEVTVNGTPCMLVSANCVNSFGKERGFPLHYVANATTTAELATLREKAAMVDELRKDAERYRWLRDGNDNKKNAACHIAVNCYGLEWDDAIDAAIAQGKGE